MLEGDTAAAQHLVQYLEGQLAEARRKLHLLQSEKLKPRQLDLEGKEEPRGRAVSEAQKVWDDLEFWRQERCGEAGLDPRLSARPPPGKLNTMMLKVWEATGITEQRVGEKIYERGSQLELVFRCYLADDFGLVDERNGEKRDPPWPIELFLHPNVCARYAVDHASEKRTPWTPAAMAAAAFEPVKVRP